MAKMVHMHGARSNLAVPGMCMTRTLHTLLEIIQRRTADISLNIEQKVPISTIRKERKLLFKN